jgi:hypothetical protein
VVAEEDGGGGSIVVGAGQRKRKSNQIIINSKASTDSTPFFNHNPVTEFKLSHTHSMSVVARIACALT